MRVFSDGVRFALTLLVGVVIFSVAMLSFTLSRSFFKYESDALENVMAATVQIGISDDPTTIIRTVGGGVVITSRKKVTYVLTAKHNLRRGDHLFIKTSDGRPFQVVYYVADAHRDLAILRVDTGDERLSVAKVGDSTKLIVGQSVFAIGYPSPSFVTDDFPTVTRGIVSALDRVLTIPPTEGEEFESETALLKWSLEYTDTPDESSTLNISMTPRIQTDASVNPGSSGGPLITEDGEVVGVVQSMVTNTGSDVGMNFVIPVSEADILLSIAGVGEKK